MVAGWEGVWEDGEKGEGISKYKQVVTEYSWGCKVQHREQSSQRTSYAGPTDVDNGLGIASGSVGGWVEAGRFGTAVMA